MRLFLLFSIFIINFSFTQVKQEKINNLFELSKLLICDSIPFNHLNKLVNQSENKEFQMNQTFSLRSKYSFEYEEVFGTESKTFSSDTLGFCDQKSIFYYTLMDLMSIFGLNEITEVNSTKNIPSCFFYDRGAKGNSTWTAYKVNDYLVIRFVHNYPNGNMTTFSKEDRFYFKLNR